MTRSKKERQALVRNRMQQRDSMRSRCRDLESSLQTAITNKQNNEIEVVLDQLIDKWKRIEEIDEIVLNELDEDEITKEITEQEEFREKATRIKVETRLILQQSTVKTPNGSGPFPPPPPPPTPSVSLPKISLKVFTGTNPMEWSAWWGSYEALVHKSRLISDVEKFTYLIRFVDGPAAELVGGYSLNPLNYQAAIAALKDQFGKKDVLEAAHFATLTHLPDASQKGDTPALRRLYNTAMTQIRSLDSLGVSVLTYGNVIKPSILTKVPTEIMLSWVRKETAATATLMDLLKHIKEELEARELVALLKKTEVTKRQEEKNSSSHGGATQSSTVIQSPPPHWELTARNPTGKYMRAPKITTKEKRVTGRTRPHIKRLQQNHGFLVRIVKKITLPYSALHPSKRKWK